MHKLQTETTQAEDLRVALEEEREAVALKYASLEIEASKKEKQRQKEFEKQLAETIDGFERQSKAFIETIEDKALQTKLEKERLSRKAELNRAVVSKIHESKSEPVTSAFTGESETICRYRMVQLRVKNPDDYSKDQTS